MTEKEPAFSEEYQEPSAQTEAQTVKASPIDKQYLDAEKPRPVAIRAKIVSEEKKTVSQLAQKDAEPTERVCQGDLIRQVAHVESIEKAGDEVVVQQVVFPLVVVLTQDCDLQQDHDTRVPTEAQKKDDDKRLISVLVAPAYNLTHFIEGSHLSELGRQMWVIPKKKGGLSTAGADITKNKNARYHCLRFDDDVEIVDSVVDFKHYFSVNVADLEQIKKANCAGNLAELYREDISQRFASFLGRIGLPNPTTGVA